MQSTKNNLFRIPKLGKFLLLTSGLLLIGSGILLGNYAVKATDSNGASSEGKIEFAGIKSENLKKNFSKTHFTLKGNDFGGGFIWLPAKELKELQVVTVNGTEYKCSTQVRGFYYNSQRGERLWPLDDQTKGELWTEYNNLTLNGGRYTNCSSTSDTTVTDPYGIYGSITHIDGLGNTYVLNAGIAYNLNNNRMKNPGSFQCNLQRLNNQFPFGYFFDNAGGIWLLGASITEHHMKDSKKNFHDIMMKALNGDISSNLKPQCLVDIATYDGENVNISNIEKGILDFGKGSALETIFKLGIRGVVGLSTQVQQEGKDGNESWTSVLVRTDNSIANIFNLTKKNAEKLCKGKWKQLFEVNQNNQGNIICISNEQWREATVSDESYLSNKTIIMKKGNLKLNSFMAANANNTTIYLMDGDLILPPETTNFVNFKGNGYLDASPSNISPKAAYLKGNFIINGLLQIAPNAEGIAKLKNKLVVHGKIASLNTLEAPNKLQRDFLEAQVLKGKQKPVILSELFDWQCNAVTGKGSDGTPCVWGGFIVDKAFSLIDMNFPSPLFQ